MNTQSKYAAKGGPFAYSHDLQQLSQMMRKGEADTDEFRELDAKWRRVHGVPPRNAPFVATADVVADNDDGMLEEDAA